MALETAAGRRALSKAYGLFAAALAFLVVVIALAAQLGLNETVIAFLVIAFALVTSAVIGVGARTLSLTEFYVAGRGVSAGFNGMATAAAFLSGGGLATIVGAFFAGTAAGLAVTAGWTIGFVLLAVLVAPYYRKSGALTLPDFLAVRYGTPLLRVAGVVVLLVSSFALLPAAIAAASAIVRFFLHMRPDVSLAVVVATLLLSSLAGGMRAVTFVAGAQVILVLLAMVVPATLFSAESFALPLPQLTYGFALDANAGSDAIGLLAGRGAPLGDLSGVNLLALAATLALAVVSLPHVVARSGTATGMASARRSVAWALAIVAAVTVTAPAIAAFARSAILDNVVGVGLDELPVWFFAFGRAGLIETCGVAAASAADIGTTCGAGTVINGLDASQVAVSGEALVLGFADMVDLPYVVSALIAAGILAAALSTAGAVLMAVTAALGHDVYARMVNRRATAGRRLIVSRLALIAAVALAAAIAATAPGEAIAFAVYTPALAASGFFPPLILGLWWERTTWLGALAGMVAGFAFALLYILAERAGVPKGV
ncbi:MAG TPA: VC_2705 family sodium/solute symporter, partial [Bauldia sp.]|nr:VC_2705 family sodium/solute symporter [Bauldia sp.]